MKRITIILFALALILLSSFCASAASGDDESIQEYYYSQLEKSGADDLYYSLPDSARDELNSLGINSADWKQLNGLSIGAFFSAVFNMLGGAAVQPLACLATVAGIIIFCAMADCLKDSSGISPLDGTVSVITALCLSSVIVFPLADTLSEGINVIQCGAGFMLLYAPIMAGILIAAGNSVTGASYYTTVMAAGEFISQIGARILSPALNMLLGITVISSLCSHIKLGGIINFVHSSFKWIVTFMMSVFVSVLSFQTFIGTAADNAGIKAAKFAISSFVPVVGGALSDAFLTVQSSLRLLKSGIGVFAMLGIAALYLPVILKCIIWLFTISAGAAVAEVFSLGVPLSLLNGVKKVAALLLALLLCCMTVLIISTAILLIVGGS